MPSRTTSSADNIVVIGGGASGLAVILQLVKRFRSGKPVRKITLIEKNEEAGPGLAYSPACAGTILNMTKSTMGLYPDNPNHFNEWKNDPSLKLYPFRENYGDYLRAMWSQSVEDIREMGGEISFIQDEVQDINRDDDGTFTLTLEKNAKTLFAKDVVLAVGNFTVTANPHLSHLPGYFPSPWPTSRLRSIPADAPVIILGSRLSAIDAANALVDSGHRGSITFMSRSGRLPKVQGAPVPFPRRYNLYTLAKHVHAPTRVGASFASLMSGIMEEVSHLAGNDWSWLLQNHECPMEELESDIKDAQEGRAGWQTVLRSTAPLVERYWRSLEMHDKKLFYDKFYSCWMRYRHGMPVENAEKILNMMKRGQLKVVKGREIESNGNGFFANTSDGKIEASYVIEATGQECRVTHAPSPLIQATMRKGMATPHPLGGFVVNFDTLSTSPGLYTIGSFTQGTHFYVSSVDRIAEHASRLADALTGEPLARPLHVAVFLRGDPFSHIMASRLVPRLLSAGHMPFLFVLPAGKTPANGTTASVRARQLAFFEKALMKQHVIPFLKDTPQNGAECLSLDQMRTTYGILVQDVDFAPSEETLHKHYIDLGLSLDCTTTRHLSTDIQNYFSWPRRLLNMHSTASLNADRSPFHLHDMQDCCDRDQFDLQTLSAEYSQPLIDARNRISVLGVNMAADLVDRVARGKDLPKALRAAKGPDTKEVNGGQQKDLSEVSTDAVVETVVKSYASPEQQGHFRKYLAGVVKSWPGENRGEAKSKESGKESRFCVECH